MAPPKRRKNFIRRTGRLIQLRKMAPLPPLKMPRPNVTPIASNIVTDPLQGEETQEQAMRKVIEDNKPDEKIQDEVKKNPSVWARIGQWVTIAGTSAALTAGGLRLFKSLARSKEEPILKIE